MALYIDPGTGSMLFTILIGIIGAALYSLRMLFVKLRFMVSGGKKGDGNKTEIPFAIFSDNRRYWNVFEPICKEMDKRGKDVVYLTMSEDDPVFDSKLEHVKPKFIGEGNKGFMKLNYLNADILLSTTPGLEVYQWKRSKQVKYYVHIPHAASDITIYRMFGIDYYDSILLSGQYQADDVRALEKLRELPEKELKLVGIPYMDTMKKRLDYSLKNDSEVNQSKGLGDKSELKKKEQSVESNQQPVVLLAPSWGPSAIFKKYGSKILDQLLETGYHVIVRPHPQSFISEKEMIDNLMKKYPESDKIEWNRDTDNFEVLKRADILVSDFSGVIFDFTLVYDKPVIYTDPKIDVSVYDAWWLEKPLWTTEILPKIGMELTEEKFDDLKDMVDSCLKDPRFAEGRDTARKETWVNPGEGAKLVADYLENKLQELEEKSVVKEKKVVTSN